MFDKKKILYTKIAGSVLLFTLALIVFYVSFTQRQTYLAPRAMSSTSAAVAKCDTLGNAVIDLTFTNTQNGGSDQDLNVTVIDDQTGKSVNLGTVPAGQSVTGKIETGVKSLTAGTVRFQLAWTDGRAGIENIPQTYSAVSCAASDTDLSPTQTITTTAQPSISPAVTTELTPTVSITATQSATLTPSVTIADSVASIPSSTPTSTPTPTLTSTPTVTPTPITYNDQSASYVAANSTATPTPTEIILAVNNTNTPTPEGDAQPTIPSAGSPLMWFTLLIPVVLLAIGFVF